MSNYDFQILSFTLYLLVEIMPKENAASYQHLLTHLFIPVWFHRFLFFKWPLICYSHYLF